MPKNIEAINKILVENGKEPLKDENAPIVNEENKGDDNTAPKIEETKDTPPAQIAEIPQLNDEAVLAYLQKNKGLTVSSFEELTPKIITQEDLEKEAEKKEAEKISWALQSGKTTAKNYSRYVAATSDKTGVVFADFRSEAIADDEEIKELLKTSPADAEARIKEEFEDKYGLNADQNSRRYKRGQLEIDVLADEIIRTNYKDILGIDADYEAHTKRVADTDNYNKKILSQAPQYKKDVEDVFAELKTIPFDFGGGEIYNIDVQPEMLKNLKEKFLEKGYSEKQIGSGWTKGEIQDTVNTAVIKQNYGVLSLEAAKQYHLKRQAGSRGIPSLDSKKVNDSGRKELTEQQKQVLTEAGRTDLVQAN